MSRLMLQTSIDVNAIDVDGSNKGGGEPQTFSINQLFKKQPTMCTIRVPSVVVFAVSMIALVSNCTVSLLGATLLHV